MRKAKWIMLFVLLGVEQILGESVSDLLLISIGGRLLAVFIKPPRKMGT